MYVFTEGMWAQKLSRSAGKLQVSSLRKQPIPSRRTCGAQHQPLQSHTCLLTTRLHLPAPQHIPALVIRPPLSALSGAFSNAAKSLSRDGLSRTSPLAHSALSPARDTANPAAASAGAARRGGSSTAARATRTPVPAGDQTGSSETILLVSTSILWMRYPTSSSQHGIAARLCPPETPQMLSGALKLRACQQAARNPEAASRRGRRAAPRRLHSAHAWHTNTLSLSARVLFTRLGIVRVRMAHHPGGEGAW